MCPSLGRQVTIPSTRKGVQGDNLPSGGRLATLTELCHIGGSVTTFGEGRSISFSSVCQGIAHISPALSVVTVFLSFQEPTKRVLNPIYQESSFMWRNSPLSILLNPGPSEFNPISTLPLLLVFVG